ncbi:response regulator [Limnofasciculus baicalensis]|uniref:Response regulator n=1 Tax=Limnofasciculus baicalensis BBK-W-15 TaxID=2699891 RepID=A0AAE3GV83_9CYAN|nr:response regulator [Limnofasciculus baicalensis]MCP2730692.1 response regulator [Limnofasciculus baicalensis BBK-W-15]
MATSKPLEISKLGWETCVNSQKAPLILVSHNDQFTRAILCLEMETEGYQVIEAYNAQQCIEAYKIFHPDLVILDAMMPGIDGFSCCRQLRKIPAKLSTPILIITSSQDTTSIEEAFVAGATDCITQPIPWLTLRPRARQLLHRSFLTQHILELSTQLAHRRLEQVPLQTLQDLATCL